MKKLICLLSFLNLFITIPALAIDAARVCEDKVIYMHSWDEPLAGHADGQHLEYLRGGFVMMGATVPPTRNVVLEALQSGHSTPMSPQYPTVTWDSEKELSCANAVARYITKYFAVNYGIKVQVLVERLRPSLKPRRSTLWLEMTADYIEKLQEAEARVP